MKGTSPKPYFSLSEEARNTERHHSGNSELKLRHSRVTFISAGASKAEDLTRIPQAEAVEGIIERGDTAKAYGSGLSEAFEKQTTTLTPANAPEIQMSSMSLGDRYNVNPGMVGCEPRNVGSTNRKCSQDEISSRDCFFTDVTGSDMAVHTGLATPKIRRSLSPAASDSSEEIILFAGRKAFDSQPQKESSLSKGQTKAQLPLRKTEPVSSPTTTIIGDPFGINLDGAPSMPKTSPRQTPVAVRVAKYTPISEKRPGSSPRKRGRKNRLEQSQQSQKAKDDAEILADYIANIDDSEDINTLAQSSVCTRRELDGSDDRRQDYGKAFTVRRAVTDDESGVEDWNSTDLQDFEELSTSSEALDAVERILSKRKRASGLQYLVVSKGYTMDDARWLPVSSLEDSGADGQIRLFEEEQAQLEHLLDPSEGSEDSLMMDKSVTMDLQDDLDDLEDERDLEERRKDRMTDEQIARLLSKQEELGLGSSDLLLYDGEDLFDSAMDETLLDGPWERPTRTQSRSKRKYRCQDTFPSATLFADVLEQDPYNGFDIMDQDRPSLRKTQKGRRGKFAPELSDSELEQSITIAWENDRTKKRIRKQEREQLRAQGLLGRKDKVDMKAKYAEGMSMDEVKGEIREFLLSSMERYSTASSKILYRLADPPSLPLPPMAQKERKIVHEIANVFKLKSKSIGAGKSRFPVLYRTARTISYDERTLSTIEATLSSKRFLPRLDRLQNRGTPTRKTRGGSASASVSYRDGEVVGAAAPELGQENRGRAMLEKMGWSTGTTLGALNNTRGIFQPVTQVVKTGKAGLG